MHFAMEILKFVALLSILALISAPCGYARKRKTSRRSKRNHATCRPKLLMRYKMTVTTTWTKQTFPKMFPTYRPHAHWSTLIGRSHGPAYQMWQEGSNASRAVRQFAEEEDAEFLEMETGQGYNNVLDIFTAPAVDESAGSTSTILMVDGRRSMVSFMMKIVPSPDWFIGLSSLDLCHRGRWKKRVRLDLRPYDAGTDQGLTFTSPNWPNEPQEPIFAITSSFPEHPASSFFYPKHKQLPRLAYIEIDLMSEYRLRRTHMALREVITTTTTTTTPKPAGDGNLYFPSDSRRRNTKSRRQVTGTPLTTDTNVILDYTQSPMVGHDARSPHHARPKIGEGSVSLGSLPAHPLAGDGGLMPRPVPRMRASGPRGSSRSGNWRRSGSGVGAATVGPLSQQSLNQPLFPEVSTKFTPTDDLYVDCLVSEWSVWTPCSKTCGFGNRQRSREVIQMPAKRGNVCPPLTENAMCGSMRTCRWSHFSMMGRKMGSRPTSGSRPSRRFRRRRRPS